MSLIILLIQIKAPLTPSVTTLIDQSFY